MAVFVGCAGWSIPKQHAGLFPTEGSHLLRYAHRFPAVEINSSFYRPHRRTTYERWAGSVPEHFRFAVKMPRLITHRQRLVGAEEALDRFLDEIGGLSAKLGPILVQLPPRLAFQRAVAEAFFTAVRTRFSGAIVCEPRHATWFDDEADRLLISFQVARVAADPAVVPRAAQPGGWDDLVYYRLHGSPQVYYSPYAADFLEALATALASRTPGQCWCIFDNTARAAATVNALELLERLEARTLGSLPAALPRRGAARPQDYLQ